VRRFLEVSPGAISMKLSVYTAKSGRLQYMMSCARNSGSPQLSASGMRRVFLAKHEGLLCEHHRGHRTFSA